LHTNRYKNAMKKINNKAALEKMIKNYLSGKANPEEIAFLEAYFQHFDQDEEVLTALTANEKLMLGEEMEANINERIFSAHKPKILTLRRLIAAAAIIAVVLSISLYFYTNNSKVKPTLVAQINTNKIVPGGNKAFLTLADGVKISLDEASIGELSKQGNVIVRKTKDGQLMYDLSGTDQSGAVAFNTIETPRGGEYQVVLPDGTKVWLNAQSKLIFPTAFRGKQRKVELIGEGYFEVAKNKRMPFLVSSAGQVVEVLGTHFNISAYPDENTMKTTLLEGSVRITKTNTNQSAMLIPGQEASIKTGGNILVAAVNTNNAVAWKNGYFMFANESLETVMTKISRWYDIDVTYKGNVTKEAFVGQVSRFEKISEVLSVLELTGLVHFKIEGRRVIAMP
jgi:transmembrane sensor